MIKFGAQKKKTTIDIDDSESKNDIKSPNKLEKGK